MLSTFFGLLPTLLLIFAILIVQYVWEPDRPVQKLEKWIGKNSKFLEVKSHIIHYRDEGIRDDEVPLVLIHGTSSSLHTWEGWVHGLETKKRIISLDLSGFGLTGPPANGVGNYSIAAFSTFVFEFLDELKVEKFSVAGNSLGGNIAWDMALLSNRVQKLILVDSAGYPPAPQSVPLGFQIARSPLLKDLVPHVLPRMIIESSVRNVFGNQSKVTSELVDRYWELTLRTGNRRALQQRFSQSDDGGFHARIAHVPQPTLVLWGARDLLIPLEHGRRFAADIADSRLVVFDELGHVPQEEDPEQTLGPVAAFLGVVEG